MAIHKKHSVGCKCCQCTTCQIDFDQFNRTDSTSLGADWTETSGDWSIASNVLTTSSDDARVTHNTSFSYDFPNYIVTVKIKGQDAGDQLDVNVGDDGAGAYLRVRATLQNGSTCGTVAIYEIDGVGSIALDTMTVPGLVEDEWHTVQVCLYYAASLYSYYYTVKVTTASGITMRVTDDTTVSGRQVGLGTGSITTLASFDDFCWQRHRLDAVTSGFGPDPSCNTCDDTECQFSEDYLTAAGTDLGCQWHECSGSWSSEDTGSGYAITTTGTGLVIHTIPHPHGASFLSASGYVKLEDSGDKVRVWVARSHLPATGCTVDSVAVELEAGTTCGVIRFFEHTGGVTQQVGSDVPVYGLTPDAWHHVHVCHGDAITGASPAGVTNNVLSLVLTTAGGTVRRTAASVLGGGYRSAAFESVAVTTKVWFRGFEFSRSYNQSHSTECPYCVTAADWCLWGTLTCGDSDTCEWTAVSGSWTCGTTSSDDATKRFEFPAPYRSNIQRMSGTVTSTGEAVAKAFVDYDDASNHLGLALYLSDATCPKAVLLEDGVAIRTVKDRRLVSGASVDYCVMYDGVNLSAWYSIDNSERIYLQATATPPTSYIKAAIGTGTVTSGSVTFSDVALFVGRHDYNDCDDCDQCLLWSEEAFANPLSCEYGGTASYDTTADGLSGATVPCAKVPAAGSLTCDVGMSASTCVAYCSFYLETLPATVTLTAMGVPASIAVDASANGTLTIGSDTYACTVQSGFQYTLKVCSVGDEDRAELIEGGLFGGTIASAYNAAGSPSGTQIKVEAATNDVHVHALRVLKYLSYFDSNSRCGSCHAFCEPCLNNIMPDQVLIEIENCDSTHVTWGQCCEDITSGYDPVGGGLAGAFYVPMTECTGSASYGLFEVGGVPRTLSVSFVDNGSSVTISVTWFYQYDYPSTGTTVTWSGTVNKPLDCTTMDRIELTMTTVLTGSDDCSGAIASATCFISAA